MALTIINHRGCPYGLDYVRKMSGVGFAPGYELPVVMEREHYGRRVSPEQAERFRNRPGRMPWPWENKDKEQTNGSNR